MKGIKEVKTYEFLEFKIVPKIVLFFIVFMLYFLFANGNVVHGATDRTWSTFTDAMAKNDLSGDNEFNLTLEEGFAGTINIKSNCTVNVYGGSEDAPIYKDVDIIQEPTFLVDGNYDVTINWYAYIETSSMQVVNMSNKACTFNMKDGLIQSLDHSGDGALKCLFNVNVNMMGGKISVIKNKKASSNSVYGIDFPGQMQSTNVNISGGIIEMKSSVPITGNLVGLNLQNNNFQMSGGKISVIQEGEASATKIAGISIANSDTSISGGEIEAKASGNFSYLMGIYFVETMVKNKDISISNCNIITKANKFDDTMKLVFGIYSMGNTPKSINIDNVNLDIFGNSAAGVYMTTDGTNNRMNNSRVFAKGKSFTYGLMIGTSEANGFQILNSKIVSVGQQAYGIGGSGPGLTIEGNTFIYGESNYANGLLSLADDKPILVTLDGSPEPFEADNTTGLMVYQDNLFENTLIGWGKDDIGSHIFYEKGTNTGKVYLDKQVVFDISGTWEGSSNSFSEENPQDLKITVNKGKNYLSSFQLIGTLMRGNIVLDPGDYILEGDSNYTSITLKKEFLETLLNQNSTYSIKFEYMGGSSKSFDFTVNKKADNSSSGGTNTNPSGVGSGNNNSSNGNLGNSDTNINSSKNSNSIKTKVTVKKDIIQTTTKEKTKKTPMTGDKNNIGLYLVLMCFASVVIATIAKSNIKSNNRKRCKY
ncbi:MAG: hypothetical protein LBM02_09335 [Lachnospiraceae bacterium]|jgi:hypothetical protein|nr:hypothetical protein [Lachnospiraceae bacterium]